MADYENGRHAAPVSLKVNKESTLKKTVGDVYRNHGMRGFYRGSLPPLFGSMMYRSSQFAIPEFFYTRFEGNSLMMTPIPGAGGIQLRTVAGGISAGIFRAIVECPFEYSKVRG